MSAAKMVADSTQSDLPEKLSKKRKKEQQKKKGKKKKATDKKGKKRSSEDEFDQSDLDLENEIRPIGFYVKNREELLKQMFHCVKGTSLQRALPEVLKELPLEDLQKRCLEQLEVISKKRIRRLIAGDDPASISSSGTEDETSEEEEEQDLEYFEPEPEEYDDDAMETGEGQIADSTSQYTGEIGDSDREFDEHEEGSLGHSSRSHTPSEEFEGAALEQEETVNPEYFEEEQDSLPIPTESVQQEAQVDEETEEGEVTDEDAGNNVEIADTKTENDNAESTKDAEENETENNENKESEKGDEKVDTSEGKEEVSVKGEGVAEGETVEDEAEEAEEEPKGGAQGSSKRVVLPPSAESLAPVLTKNQMELLELEMRARAIKAMLKTAK